MEFYQQWQQIVLDNSRFPAAFVEKAWRGCKNLERLVTEVHWICVLNNHCAYWTIIVRLNNYCSIMKNILLEDNFITEKREENG